jgi:hypothetical protein
MARTPLILAMLWMGGCATTIVPPHSPSNPTVVAVTDYGRHSSLLIPDARGAGSVEYAFGDWRWFAEQRNSPVDGCGALFFSAQATLGRMRLERRIDSPDLAKILGADRVLLFHVSGGDVTALRRELDDRFTARADTAVFNPKLNLFFVPDPGRYSLWRNCNHVTAEWLEALGCRIKGSAITSNFRLAR